MGFVGIFWKKNIWKTYLPKTSIVGQIVLEILVPFCSDDFIQILSNLIWFLILWTETNLEGFVWNHQSITSLISPSIFGERAFLSLFLSDHLTQSHNFINLVFVTSSLLHSVEVQVRPFKPSFVYHQSAKPRKSKIYFIRNEQKRCRTDTPRRYQ